MSENGPKWLRDADNESQTAFGALSQGKTVGKRAPLLVGNVKDQITLSPTNLLTVEGPDDVSMGMCLTLSPPQFVPESLLPGFPNIDVQAIKGFLDVDLTSGVFPQSDLTALLEWGSGGVQNSAEIDMMNGAIVNLHGSYLRVRGKTVQGTGGLNTGGVYQLAACVSPGAGQDSTCTLTKNFAGGLAIAAATPNILVPRFARYVTMVCQVNSLQLRFWRDANRTILVGSYSMPGVAGTPTLATIPNGAYYMDANNASGAVAGALSLIFHLCL